MATLEQYKLLDKNGLVTMLTSLFETVEGAYTRRSGYIGVMKEITAELDKIAEYVLFQFSIDTDTSALVLSIPDTADDPDMEIDTDGNLILNSNDTQTDAVIASWAFNINTDDGCLYATYSNE